MGSVRVVVVVAVASVQEGAVVAASEVAAVIDPEVVVVAVRGLNAFEGFATVVGAPETYIEYVNAVLVLRVCIDAAVVPCPLAKIAIGAGLDPGFSRIV